MSIAHRGTRWAAQGTVLAVAALLYFVDLFLPWAQSCLTSTVSPFRPYPGPFSPTSSHATIHATTMSCSALTDGWGGAGTVAGVLVALLVLWEAARVARLGVGIGIGYRSLISSVLVFGVVLFTIINVAARLTWMHSTSESFVYGGTFLWIAVALAVVIALGGMAHWRLWLEHVPAPGGPGGAPPAVATGFTAPEPPPPPAPRVCSNCGRVNAPDAQFCSACGTNLTEPTLRRRSARRPPEPT
ncbi:MAG TPA: zinc ribbon domain-containing protein [Candidatus Dormibacteraeota bacterium]|nr:zinc ribbon domain-containing protein [Candidatus Dormibacteraeota bacterium]